VIIKINNLFAKDKWLTLDKPIHIVACIVITYLYGAPMAMGVGLIKETSDIGGSGFSYKDLCADVIGTLIGMLLRAF